jgi:hypothetical protein
VCGRHKQDVVTTDPDSLNGLTNNNLMPLRPFFAIEGITQRNFKSPHDHNLQASSPLVSIQASHASRFYAVGLHRHGSVRLEDAAGEKAARGGDGD